MALSKFVDSSFPQCNIHTGVQGGYLAFTPLDSYLKLRIDSSTHDQTHLTSDHRHLNHYGHC